MECKLILIQMRTHCADVRERIARMATRAGSDVQALQHLSLLSHNLNEMERRLNTTSRPTPEVISEPIQSNTAQNNTPKTNIKKTIQTTTITRPIMKKRRRTIRCCASCNKTLEKGSISSLLCNPCSVDLAGMALMLVESKRTDKTR